MPKSAQKKIVKKMIKRPKKSPSKPKRGSRTATNKKKKKS